MLDKNPRSPITGTGLEPLRHSRVLESIDLRQCSSWTADSTGLNDELVTDILSTMLPHKLKSVKVRKQNDTGNVAFDQYCFPWSLFRCKSSEKFWREERFSAPCVRSTAVSRGTDLLRCPDIQQCRECLEWCCSCRQVTECNFCFEHICSECEEDPLSCPWCGETSCADCSGVEQCKICRVINCVSCGANETPATCDRCNGTFCEECRYVDKCSCCGESFCEECGLVDFCDWCDETMCLNCQREGQFGKTIVKCNSCGYSACDGCTSVSVLDKCAYCGVGICHDESDCAEKHVCRSPAELEHMPRNAREGDDKANLCSCGKKHLSSPKGQTFICGWLHRIDTAIE